MKPKPKRKCVSLVLLALCALSAPFSPVFAQAPAPSGSVITIAGNGSASYSGDGGPATNAALYEPWRGAIGPDGTFYFIDSGNNRVRAIDPVNGILSTVAGNGATGNTGNGGPATNATLSGPNGLAVDRARHALYIAEFANFWVRKVNLTNGVIDVYAGDGTFGFGTSGDSGLATSAQFSTIYDVGVDDSGRLVISDSGFNNRVRQVDPLSGIISTLAGTTDGGGVTSGDGGPAIVASFTSTGVIATDGAGNVFVQDIENNGTPHTNVVRRIDVATGIIDTIAGGGTNVPGSGPATSMKLSAVQALAVDNAGTELFIATFSQVYKVDLATGMLTVFAGSTNAAYSGDGGPATNAEFNSILGLTVPPGGGLVIADSLNHRVRYIVPDSVNLTNDSRQTGFYLPWASTLSGDCIVSGNSSLTTIDLGSLVSTGGALDLSGNTGATTIDLSSLVTVGGDVSVDGNRSATLVDLSSLASTGGALDLSGNTGATTVDLSSLVTVGGEVSVDGNGSATLVDLSSLATGGTIDLEGNTAATNIDLCSLANLTGDLTITSNAPDAQADLCSLTSFGNPTNETTMTVDGNVTVTNGLTIETNGTLAGDATLDGSVTNNGTISPGASPGHLDFTGNLVLHATSRLLMQLGGFSTNQIDRIDVGGGVTLDGALSVSLLDEFLPVMTNGASFTLLTAGSPFTGALASVADGGTLTTTDGYARFTVHYAGENTLRLTDLVIVDTDSDNLPDWWEDRYGLSKTNAADAALDPDGDGASSLNEFLAGTNPTNAASVFRITDVESESGGVRVSWSTVGGKSYRLQTNGELTEPFADFSPLLSVPGTNESTTNLLDSDATNFDTRFYRVRLGP